MSFILGSWQYKNDSQQDQGFSKMYEAVQMLPHVNKSFVLHKQITFGHVLTYNTPEAIHEKLPVYLPEYQILFTAQGRIDNRQKLADLLNLKIDDNCPDGYIILQAYIKWGKDCVNIIRGDWSFAVFDYKEQELFIARDPMGYTSIYYYHDNSGFYFSSSVKSILLLDNYKKQPNQEHFIKKLTLWGDDAEDASNSFYKGIYSIPPAHTLIIKNNNILQNKYWNPQNTPLRFYKNKQDYAHEMLGIFSSAINERLRSYKPVASMLSGGLDSSTVSYIAADILRSNEKRLTTFSHVPLFTNEVQNDQENRFRVLDETPFIKEVARSSGNIDTLFLMSENYSIIRGMEDAICYFNTPSHASGNLYWIMDIYQTVANKGLGTLLSGEGGNGSISFAGIDYLLPFNLASLMQHPFRFFKNQVAKPIAKMYFNEWLNKRKSIHNSLKKYASSVFLRQEILDQYAIIEDIENNKKEFHKYIKNIQDAKSSFIDAYYSRSGMGAACCQHYGFELRDPCTDVDVMEYFFSIPNEVFFDDHYNNRMLVKRMMKDKIPASVLFEKRKGLQSADIAYRVKAQAHEISGAIEKIQTSAAANHYIDTKNLAATWQLYLNSSYVQPYQMHRLLKALQFALFLQINFE